ncbi:MAG: alpha/beta hydrolase-fold protein [Fuerstiella sp.]|nr:alpha/beta hydrolase-fold protein [Fuerstiella sp.]
MKRFELRSVIYFLFVLLTVVSFARAGDEIYRLGKESLPQDNVPKGELTEYTWKSKVFQETIRRYWVYVPSQYDASKPAAVMVFQDGHAYVDKDGWFRTPVVFDNLIHAGELPVIIGIFIDPGHKTETLPQKAGWRPRAANRDFEYDSMSALYAQFLLEEILPEVGQQYQLTDDPDQRAICGISSGGICAWTAAWQRPDAFRKVLSHVGSFVNIRGGHVYPALIRKSARRPIRVFLQGGSEDLNNAHGNWPLANQQMASALDYADYDYRFEYGEGAHNGIHGGAILPDSLRWLWRDKR